MRRLRRFAALPPDDRRLLAAAVVLHTVVRIALRVLPFAVARRLIARTVPAAGRTSAAPERIAWAVAGAARHAGRGTCLTQALTVHALLARHGHAPRLHLGVAFGAERRLEAHAWIENAGVVIGTEPAARYQRLPAFEGRDR